MKIASIDIGTNTILMLIADVDLSGNINVIHEEFAIARLGENTDKTAIICEDAIIRASKILEQYKNICRAHNVDIILPVATSAMREATNKDIAKLKFESILGFPLIIINGETEALLSYIGTVASDETALLIDIGGGSTEIVSGKSNSIVWRRSYDVGAVRISERFFQSKHPPKLYDIKSAKDFLLEIFKGLSLGNTDSCKIYAVAGTATTIATTIQGFYDYEVSKIDGFELTYSTLQNIYETYLDNSTDDIIHKFKVSPGRAGLIFAGSLILLTIFDILDITKCIISSKGLRYGIIKGRLQGLL